MNKTRLEAFSDGVFAIVITLLILNIRIPDGRTLTFQSLWPLVPPLATFVCTRMTLNPTLEAILVERLSFSEPEGKPELEEQNFSQSEGRNLRGTVPKKWKQQKHVTRAYPLP